MHLFKSAVCLFLVVSVSQCHNSEKVLKNDKKDVSETGYSYNVQYLDKTQNKGYGYKVQVPEDDKKKKSWTAKQQIPETTTVTPLKTEEFKPSPRGPQIYIESTSGKIPHIADLTQRATKTKDYKSNSNENQYKTYSTPETLPEKLPEASAFTYSQSVQHNSKLTTPQFEKFSAEDGLPFPTKEYQSQLHNGASEQIVHSPKEAYVYSTNTKYYSEPIKSTRYINSEPSESNIYATDRPTTKEYYYSPKNYQQPQYYSEPIKPTQDVYNGAPQYVIYTTETPEFNHYSTNDQSYTPDDTGAFPEKSPELNKQSYYSTVTQAYPIENGRDSPEKSLKGHELNQQSYYSKDTQAYPFENSKILPEKSSKSLEINQASYYTKDAQTYPHENKDVLSETTLKNPVLSYQSYYATHQQHPQDYVSNNHGVSREKAVTTKYYQPAIVYSTRPQIKNLHSNPTQVESSNIKYETNEPVSHNYNYEKKYSSPLEVDSEIKVESPEQGFEHTHPEKGLYYSTKYPGVYSPSNQIASTNNKEVIKYVYEQPQKENEGQLYGSGVADHEINEQSRYQQPETPEIYRTNEESSQVQYLPTQDQEQPQYAEAPYLHQHTYKASIEAPTTEATTNNYLANQYNPEQSIYASVAQNSNEYLPKTYTKPTQFEQSETSEVYRTNEENSHYPSGVHYLPTQEQKQPQYASAPYEPHNTYKANIEATTVVPNNYLVNQYNPQQSIYSSVELNSNEYLPKTPTKPTQFEHPQYSTPEIEEYRPQYAPRYSETIPQNYQQVDAINPRNPKSLGYSGYYYMIPIQQNKYPYRYNHANDQKMSVMYDIVSGKKNMPKVKMSVYEPRFEYSFENKAYKNAHGMQNQYQHGNVETFDFPADTKPSMMKQTYHNNFDQHFVGEDSKKQYGYKAMMY